MVLINPLLSKDIKLVAVGTEIPINIKPSNYPYIIGKSSSSSDFCIDSAVISRVHARITEELGDYFIEDLNSTNGTFLNGEKLEPHKHVTDRNWGQNYPCKHRLCCRVRIVKML